MSIAETVHATLIRTKKKLALAESCTGGAIAARLTAIPGASLFFLGSIVAYTPRWKERYLHVSPETLKQHSAESKEVVEEMVAGLFFETEADVALAISGFAGPSGKAPGTIFIGIGARGKEVESLEIELEGDRAEVIAAAVDESLHALMRIL